VWIVDPYVDSYIADGSLWSCKCGPGKVVAEGESSLVVCRWRDVIPPKFLSLPFSPGLRAEGTLISYILWRWVDGSRLLDVVASVAFRFGVVASRLLLLAITYIDSVRASLGEWKGK
jgi:hypothetical protein